MRALPISALLAPALLLAGVAQAAEDVPYRPDGFLRTGYSDRQVAPDVWRVKGSSHASGGGVAVALYRAAELAMAAHVGEVRITSQKVRSQTMSRRSDHSIMAFTETATVTVRAVRTAADRTACDEQEARQCMTLPVAGLLARFGDRLGQPTARPGEDVARPVALVTYDPRQGGPAPWQVEAARRWPEPVTVPVRMTPDLALLLGRMAASHGDRTGAPRQPSSPAAAMPVTPAATLVATPVPLPTGLQPLAPAAPRLSAVERERARLRAAAATDGDAQ
ncbi:MAG: hypothetical protein ACRYFW_10085 [Janthinobacterium lividum]